MNYDPRQGRTPEQVEANEVQAVGIFWTAIVLGLAIFWLAVIGAVVA